MKAKTTLSILAIFTFAILLSSIVSAQAELDFNTGAQTIDAGFNASYDLINNGNDSTGTVQLSVLNNGDFGGTFSPSSGFSISAEDSQEIIFIPSGISSLGMGTHEATIRATSGSLSDETVLTIRKGFCTNGNLGGLEISDISIDNNGNGDDTEWNLLDEVVIEVEVTNNGNEDLEDIIVEMGLFKNGVNDVDELDFQNSDEEKEDLGDLDSDDDDTIEFEFDVPADFEKGNWDLVIKAYEKGNEDEQCTNLASELGDDSTLTIDIDVADKDNAVVVDDIIVPNDAVCGETVNIRFTVYNVGDDDQDQVLITLQNSQLGLDEEFTIRQDLDEGDSEDISFNFEIPGDIDEDDYTLEFRTYYDFDSDAFDDDGDDAEERDFYEERSEDVFRDTLNVISCGPVSPGSGNSIISASLTSDAISGEVATVSATITNIGSSSNIFLVDARGYATWAGLEGISERSLNLNRGESRTITLELAIDEDVDGEQTFFVEVTDAQGNLQTREVRVNVEGSNGRITLGELFGGNALIWIIGAINLILIILIIVVAVRVSRS